MDQTVQSAFDLKTYFTTGGIGRRIVGLKAKQILFAQGTPADSVYYLRAGRAKLTVVSKNGKEATITLVAIGEFIGDEAIAPGEQRRPATATAISACIVVRIERAEMMRLLDTERVFSAFYLKSLLEKSLRTQADLIDQLFNSAEKRLARTLLIMAEYGEPGQPTTFIPAITQETLAEMIGTTRSRVSYFMNRFRKLGYVEYRGHTYKGHIRIHKSLLNAVLLDHLPEENAMQPAIAMTPSRANKAEQKD